MFIKVEYEEEMHCGLVDLFYLGEIYINFSKKLRKITEYCQRFLLMFICNQIIRELRLKLSSYYKFSAVNLVFRILFAK